MADKSDKMDGSVGKARAAATAGVKPRVNPVSAKAAKPKAARAALKVKTATKAAPPKGKTTKLKASVAKPKPAPAKAPMAPVTQPTFTELPIFTALKEQIMATAKTQDYTNMMADMQSGAKDAMEKGNVAVGEITEFTKGNVEALVESGKIMAGGVQELGKVCAEEAKTAFETMSADMKEMAAIKSPTELFQLQGAIMRRNFDALMANGTKSAEAMQKLVNDSLAPVSGRVNMAAEKVSKASKGA